MKLFSIVFFLLYEVWFLFWAFDKCQLISSILLWLSLRSNFFSSSLSTWYALLLTFDLQDRFNKFFFSNWSFDAFLLVHSGSHGICKKKKIITFGHSTILKSCSNGGVRSTFLLIRMRPPKLPCMMTICFNLGLRHWSLFLTDLTYSFWKPIEPSTTHSLTTCFFFSDDFFCRCLVSRTKSLTDSFFFYRRKPSRHSAVCGTDQRLWHSFCRQFEAFV